MPKRLVVGVALVGLALVTGACGNSPRLARIATPAAMPDDFADAFHISGVGTSEALWTMVTGRPDADRDELQLRVYRLDADGTWTRLGRPISGVSGDTPVVTASLNGAPCVAYAAGSKAFITCWRGRKWARLGSRRSFRRAAVVGLRTVAGTLHALFVSRRRNTAWIARFGHHHWRRVGPRLNVAGSTVHLGEGPGSAIDVLVVEQRRRGRLHIWTLREHGWHQRLAPLRHPGFGPTTSGPVRARGRVFVPVTTASSGDWSLSIFVTGRGRWQVAGGRALNRGEGSAQGTLGYASGRVWATWQQNDPRRDARFNTRIYTVEVAATGTVQRPDVLWSGVSIGPSDTLVVEALGRPFALFMTGRRPD